MEYRCNLNNTQKRMKGIFLIHREKDIYIGYTNTCFGNRYREILKGKQPYLLEMLEHGAIFDVLWTTNVWNISYIKLRKRLFIREFQYRGYNILNR